MIYLVIHINCGPVMYFFRDIVEFCTLPPFHDPDDGDPMWNAFSRGSAVAEGPHIRGTLHWSVSLLCPRYWSS